LGAGVFVDSISFLIGLDANREAANNRAGVEFIGCAELAVDAEEDGRVAREGEGDPEPICDDNEYAC
jgi:hypothetical protein